MAVENDDTECSWELAFGFGMGAGVLFCAIWGGLTAAFSLWSDLSPIIVGVLSSGAAAGMASYKIGSSVERIGVMTVFTMAGAIFLSVILAYAKSPLESVLVTIAQSKMAFYVLNILLGSLIGTIFGKRQN